MMKKAFLVLLAGLLSLSVLPSAFAAEAPVQVSDDSAAVAPESDPSPVLPSDSDDVSSPEQQPADESAESDEPEAISETSEELGSPEEDLSVLSVVDPTIDYAPIKNTTTAKVTIVEASDLVSAGVDTVAIKAEMTYGATVMRTVEITHTIVAADAVDGFTIDLENYGRFSVVATFKQAGTVHASKNPATVDITADEYNIAPVSATLPVTFFSLSLWGDGNIRYQEDGTVIPTIVMMERPNAWNWNNLPEGVYGLPYLTWENLTTQPPIFNDAANKFRSNTTALNDYVKQLYAISPNAKFNLYLVDYYLGLIQTALYANKIPESQYTITILSDGAWSYTMFTNMYDTYISASPSATHTSYKSEWANAKSYAYNNGRVQNGGTDTRYDLHYKNGLTYAAVDLEPKAEWWLVRPALLETKKDSNAFGLAARANPKVKAISIANLLKGLENEGSGVLAEFKALYDFGDTYFADAETAGKDVMLFLGSTVGAEAGSFPDYAKFVMDYYGDEFAYYYKGHPGTPTEMYPSKQAELTDLGIIDVDSSIAAELILFFYPDIYLSGYQSSTYASVQDNEMTKGLFASKKATVDKQYLELMDFFVSPVDSTTPAAIRALCKTGVKSYLVEFADAVAQETGYSIAIWEPQTLTTTYYRLFNGAYVRYQENAQIVTIVSSLASNKLVDIAGGSTANGANVQLYTANESAAQRFRLIPDEQGYYTIMALKSGKVLDVWHAGTKSGTNVWQYAENGTDAQKWRLEPTGDSNGSMYIISKLNSNLYLDVAAARTANGTNIQVYAGNQTPAQKFILKDINPVIEDGTYTIQSKVGSDMVLDVAAGSKSSGANIQIYKTNGTPAQKFTLRFDEFTGYYTVTNVGSGKVLDVQYAGQAPATNVWQHSFNNTAAQQWSVSKLSDGSFTFRTAIGNGYCLDVSGGHARNQTNVQVYPSNGTNAQKWVLGTS
jgi:hypothetical protein